MNRFATSHGYSIPFVRSNRKRGQPNLVDASERITNIGTFVSLAVWLTDWLCLPSFIVVALLMYSLFAVSGGGYVKHSTAVVATTELLVVVGGGILFVLVRCYFLLKPKTFANDTDFCSLCWCCDGAAVGVLRPSCRVQEQE